MFITLIVITLVFCSIWFGPRARLDAKLPGSNVPTDLEPGQLAQWLEDRERAVPDLVEGAGACIQFADPEQPAHTPLVFLYIHGFSATWPETAPVTENLAREFGANVLQARLAGHGTDPETMVTPAEDWLQSMADSWQIARQLGHKVVIVASSTGAPLSVWLAHQPGVKSDLHALLFMSPNFGIRSHFDFLITAPWSRFWLHLFIGRTREWEPINEEQAKYWAWRYSTLALIEMQKVVNWLRKEDLRTYTTPLAVMYMKNDPTIDPEKAVVGFGQWGARKKTLIPVTLDGDAPEHVFVGRITSPHRVDWVVNQFANFVRELPPVKPV